MGSVVGRVERMTRGLKIQRWGFFFFFNGISGDENDGLFSVELGEGERVRVLRLI